MLEVPNNIEIEFDLDFKICEPLNVVLLVLVFIVLIISFS